MLIHSGDSDRGEASPQRRWRDCPALPSSSDICPCAYWFDTFSSDSTGWRHLEQEEEGGQYMTTQTRGDWKTNFAISFLWKWKCYFFKRKSFFPFSFSSACYVVLSLSFLFLGPACARFPANLVNFIFLSFPFLGSPIDLFPNRETCQQPRDIFPFFGQKVSFSDLPPKEREKDLSRVTSFFCRLKVKPFSFFLFCRFFRLRGKEELCLAVKMPNVVWLFVSPFPHRSRHYQYHKS